MGGTAEARDERELTIDELAGRVGLTVRNLREWRALGLVPPARMRGRIGYYDLSLVDRIEAIRRLQKEGFTLDLIRRMLDAAGEDSDHALRFAEALRAPFREEDPPIADLAELGRVWGVTDPSYLDRAVELGLLRQRDDGRYEFTSARVARVGEALNRLGLSVDEVVEATAAIRAHADGIAGVFDRVWLKHVWEPFVRAGKPVERWPDIRRTLDEVHPLALDAVVGLFSVAMEATVERSISREIGRSG